MIDGHARERMRAEHMCGQTPGDDIAGETERARTQAVKFLSVSVNLHRVILDVQAVESQEVAAGRQLVKNACESTRLEKQEVVLENQRMRPAITEKSPVCEAVRIVAGEFGVFHLPCSRVRKWFAEVTVDTVDKLEFEPLRLQLSGG